MLHLINYTHIFLTVLRSLEDMLEDVHSYRLMLWSNIHTFTIKEELKKWQIS